MASREINGIGLSRSREVAKKHEAVKGSVLRTAYWLRPCGFAKWQRRPAALVPEIGSAAGHGGGSNRLRLGLSLATGVPLERER